MSINQATANANTQATVTAIQTAADTAFIANVDAQITAAISQGQFQVTAMSNPGVNLVTVFQYYANLGYLVTFPDFLQQNGAALPSLVQQPVNFFGFLWTQFWQNPILMRNMVTNPARMTVSWGPPPPPPGP